MLLWLGLSFVLITVDCAQAHLKDTRQDKSDEEALSYCGDSKVLLKIWDLLSSLLSSDGETVTAPTPDQLHYALTLIKKALLETEAQNSQSLDALRMNELKLREKKGIHLDDNTPLTNLLQLESYKNLYATYNSKFGMNPQCKTAFLKNVRKSREEVTNLAKSPICSSHNINNPGINVQPRSQLNINEYKRQPYFNYLANYPKDARDIVSTPMTHNAANDGTQQFGNYNKQSEAQSLTDIGRICGDSKVLFKIWNILSSLIGSDGKTVQAPTRDQIYYALTIIKKSLLESQNQNAQILDALFLYEVKLGEQKGIHLDDKRSLQHLLDLELDQDFNMFHEHKMGHNPYCKEAFIRLVQKARDENAKLLESPICGDNSNPANNIEPQRLEPEKINKPSDENLQQVDKIIKNYQKHNVNIDIDHAKNVADAINSIYQPNDDNNDSDHYPEYLKPGMPAKPTLHTYTYNEDTITGTVNHQPSSYLNQNYNSNMQNEVPMIGTQNQRPDSNRAKLMQPIESTEDASTSTEEEDSSSEKPFVNSKYHPTHYHNNQKTYPTPQYYVPKYTADLNNNQMTDQINNIPSKPNLRDMNYPNTYQYNGNEQGTPTNTGFNLQANSFYKNPDYVVQKYEMSQNDYPFQGNVQSYNTYYPQNKISQTPLSQSSYSSYAVQNHPKRTNKLMDLNNPNNYFGYPNYNSHMKSVRYTSTSQTNNIPDKTSYAAIYNDNKATMDTLAKWVSGTNPSKLNSVDNSNAEIELTYLIKKPPLLLPATYFIKFRLPYATFTQHLHGLLNSQLRSSDYDLYRELVNNYNATVIKPDSGYLQEAMNQMEESHLVKARLIEPTVATSGDSKYKVNIVNVVGEGLDGADVEITNGKKEINLV